MSQFGETSKTATLSTNDSGRPEIVFTLTAFVIRGTPLRPGRHIGPVFVSPDSRVALVANPGKKASAELAITADYAPVRILRVEGGTKYFSSRVEVVEPGRSYKIVLESLPSSNSGTFKDKLRVVTDNPTLPGLPLDVFLTVYPKQ